MLRRRRFPVDEERRWQRAQRAGRRWAWAGIAAGAVLGVVRFAPAQWLADAVQHATGQRVLLAEARGSIWNGDAVLVLGGGPGSRDSSALPGRLYWRLTPNWSGLKITAIHACCLHGQLHLQLRPGWRSLRLDVPPRPQGLGHWPARWIAGLGTPWNTLQLDGRMEVATPGLQVHWVQGRVRLDGELGLALHDVSSRLSPIEPLGSYRVVIRGQADGSESAALALTTLHGPLRLTGSGQWTGARLRFRGEAQASPAEAAALASLLNIIGRRQGASTVISIG